MLIMNVVSDSRNATIRRTRNMVGFFFSCKLPSLQKAVSITFIFMRLFNSLYDEATYCTCACVNTTLTLVTPQTLLKTTHKQWCRAKVAYRGSKRSQRKVSGGASSPVRTLLGFMLIHYSIRPRDRDKDQHVSKWWVTSVFCPSQHQHTHSGHVFSNTHVDLHGVS